MRCACLHPSFFRYSLHLPRKGWPGWVSLSAQLHTKMVQSSADCWPSKYLVWVCYNPATTAKSHHLPWRHRWSAADASVPASLSQWHGERWDATAVHLTMAATAGTVTVCLLQRGSGECQSAATGCVRRLYEMHPQPTRSAPEPVIHVNNQINLFLTFKLA